MHNQAENLNETILLRQNENGQLHPLHRTNIDPEIQVSMPVYEAGNQEAVVMRSRPSAAVRAEFEEAGEAEILSQRSVASSARVRQRNAEVTRRNVNVFKEVFGARSGNFEERPSTVDRVDSVAPIQRRVKSVVGLPQRTEASEDRQISKKEQRHHTDARTDTEYRSQSSRRRKEKRQSENDNTPKKERKSRTSKHKGHYIKPEKFDGESCVETFLIKFEDAAEFNPWTPRSKASHLISCLVGDAGYLVWETKGKTYEEIVDKLRGRYGTRRQQDKFRAELKYRTRRPGENLQALFSDVERLTALAYPKADRITRDIIGMDAFIDALGNSGLEQRIREKDPESMRQALTIAMRLEVLDESRRLEDEQHRPKTARSRMVTQENKSGKQNAKPVGPADTSAGPADTAMTEARKTNEKERQRSYRGDERQQSDRLVLNTAKYGNTGNGKTPNTPGGGGSAACRDEGDQKSEIMKEIVDELRSQLSNLAAERTERPSFQASMPMPPVNTQTYRNTGRPSDGYSYPVMTDYQQRTPLAQPRYQRAQGQRGPQQPSFNCYHCGYQGHIKRNCPQLLESQIPTSGNGQQHVRGVFRHQRTPEKVYLKVKVRNKTHYCLLDTGCQVTIIPAKFVSKHQICNTATKLLAANGTDIPVAGWATVKGSIGSTQITITGLVSEHMTEIMLGFDWLEKQGAQWNFVDGKITIEGREFRLCEKRNSSKWCRRVIVDSDTVIPTESQYDVTAKTVFNSVHTGKDMRSATWSTEPAEVKDGLLVASAILPNRATKLPVRVMNTTKQPVKLT